MSLAGARTRARAWRGPMSDVQRGELAPGGPGLGEDGTGGPGLEGGAVELGPMHHGQWSRGDPLSP